MAGNAATLVLNWVRRNLPEEDFFEPLDIVIRRCFFTTFSLEWHTARILFSSMPPILCALSPTHV